MQLATVMQQKILDMKSRHDAGVVLFKTKSPLPGLTYAMQSDFDSKYYMVTGIKRVESEDMAGN